jgi:O-antigen/teichoic acid export membrane protein
LRSIRVLRNVVSNYLRYFLAGVIGFVLTPIMVHLLGDGSYGLWVAVFSLTGYFGLFDQGIRPSLVRYVSRDHTRGDYEGVSRTLSSAIALYTCVGLLAMAVTAAAAANVHHFMKLTPDEVAAARRLVWIAGVSVAIGFPLGVFGAALSGLQRYDVANAIGLGVTLVRAVAFVVVLRLGGGLEGLAWVSLAMNVVGHLLSWWWVRRLLPQAVLSRGGIRRETLERIASYSGYAFLGALANSITFQTDALVIAGFLGAAYVTPFALAAGLVEHARTLVYSATFVLSPTASELETRGESQRLHDMVVAGSKYSVLVSWPVLFALVLFGDALLRAWVGDAHAGAAVLLTVLALPNLIALPQAAASSALYGVSRHRGVVALSVLNALLNLGLSILWVRGAADALHRYGTMWPPTGLLGVAMGTAVPLVVVGGLATAWYTCRALQLPVRRYFGEGLLQPALVTLAFLVPATIVKSTLRPEGWLSLGLAFTGCWLVFAAVAWRRGMNDAERARWGRMVPGLFGLPAAGRS